MKAKEIEKLMGTQELVAVASYGTKDFPYCRPAIIQAMRQPRKVYSGARWDFSGHTANDGVTVQFAAADGTEGKTDTVAPVKIYATWLDYEAQRKARDERKATADKARQDSAANAEMLRASLLAAIGREPNDNGVVTRRSQGGGYTTIEMSQSAAADLLLKLTQDS